VLSLPAKPLSVAGESVDDYTSVDSRKSYIAVICS
jgi:hypothetical protein